MVSSTVYPKLPKHSFSLAEREQLTLDERNNGYWAHPLAHIRLRGMVRRHEGRIFRDHVHRTACYKADLRCKWRVNATTCDTDVRGGCNR